MNKEMNLFPTLEFITTFRKRDEIDQECNYSNDEKDRFGSTIAHMSMESIALFLERCSVEL